MKKLITLLVAAMLSVLSAMGAVQLQHNGKTYTMSPTIKGSSVYAVAIDGYNTANNGGIYILDNGTKYGQSNWTINYGTNWTQLTTTENAIYIKNNGNNTTGNFIVEYNTTNHQARALQKQTVQIFGGTQGQWDNYTTLTFTDGCYQADFTATATYYFRYKYNNTEYQPYGANFDASSQDKYYSANAGRSYAFYIQPGSYKICVSADGKNVFVVKQNAKTGYYVFGNINDVDNWSDTNAAQRITLTKGDHGEYYANIISNKTAYFRYVWNGTEKCPDYNGKNYFLTEEVTAKATNGDQGAFWLLGGVNYTVYFTGTSVRITIDRSGSEALNAYFAGEFNGKAWSDDNRISLTRQPDGVFTGEVNLTNGSNGGVYMRLNIDGKWYGYTLSSKGNQDMAANNGINGYQAYRTDYNYTLAEGRYRFTVNPATKQISIEHLGDIVAVPNIYVIGHPGHNNSKEQFQAGGNGTNANHGYINPSNPSEFIIPWEFAEKVSNSDMTSGQMYWYLCKDQDGNRYVPNIGQGQNIVAVTGHIFDTEYTDEYKLKNSTGNWGSFFTCPGKYEIVVTLDANQNPIRMEIRGKINYPQHIYLIGDVCDANDGNEHQGNPTKGITMVDVQKDPDFDIQGQPNVDGISGYYIAREVKFHNHKAWHDYDKYPTNQNRAMFTFASSLAVENEILDADKGKKEKWYDYLGTRYASVYDASKLNRDPNTDFSYVNVKPFNFDQLSWNNNLKEFQHPDWKDESDGFQQMEVGSVNATCFTVDITSTGVNPSYGMRYSTQYPAGTYDVLMDLNNRRVALSNSHMTTGVEDIEEMFGENIVNVYNMQGVLIRANVMEKDALTNLPKGIYLVGKKKIMVR